MSLHLLGLDFGSFTAEVAKLAAETTKSETKKEEWRDVVGFDWGALFSKAAPAAEGAASAGAKSLDESAAKKKAAQEATSSAAKVIAADVKATAANAEALFTAYYAKSGDAANKMKADAAKLVADAAMKVQDTASEGISDDAKKLRIAAADKASVAASEAAARAATLAANQPAGAKPAAASEKEEWRDIAGADVSMDAQKASALAKAASLTAEKARGKEDKKEEKWSPKDPIAQPPGMSSLKIAAYAAGGIGVVGVLALVLKKVLKR